MPDRPAPDRQLPVRPNLDQLRHRAKGPARFRLHQLEYSAREKILIQFRVLIRREIPMPRLHGQRDDPCVRNRSANPCE